MGIIYRYGENLYINLTNACTNACVFCIRRGNSGLGGYNLWLEKEPTAAEVLQAVEKENKSGEAVFCGFGEPLLRPRRVLEVAEGLQRRGWPVRINTNGHGELLTDLDLIPLLGEVIDAISISLNAQDEPTYREICNPIFGAEAYPAMLEFARKAVGEIPEVVLSVVDFPGVSVDICRQKAEKIGAKFRIR